MSLVRVRMWPNVQSLMYSAYVFSCLDERTALHIYIFLKRLRLLTGRRW